MLVNIRDGLQLLDVRQCRIVVLPDGTRGAVWRGLAYPLRPDDSIEVTDAAVPPSACRQTASEPISIAHALIEGSEEAWLIVAGSVTDRDWAAGRLKEGGITVLRTGPWLGDPVDGIAADWFVRFLRPTIGEPLPDLLTKLVGMPASPRTAPGETRLRLVEAELASARQREALLRRQLARTQEATQLATSVVDPEVQMLREALAAESALRASAEAALASANVALAQVTTETAGVTPVPASRVRPPSSSGRRVADEVATVLATFLPRVHLLRDGLTVISAEFRERGSLYRAISELQPPPARLSSSWKKLQGADGWWERHVSTGEDDSGRVYARWEVSDQRWAVLVSHKGDQTRDIGWLRRQ